MKLLKWFKRLFKPKENTRIIASKNNAILPKEIDNKFEQLKHCVEYLNEFNSILLSSPIPANSKIVIECKLNIIDLLNRIETYVNSINEGGDLKNAKGIQHNSNKILSVHDYFSKDNYYIKPDKAYYLLTDYTSQLLIALLELYDTKQDYYDRKLTLILREVCVAIETLYIVSIESHDRKSQNERNTRAS